MHSEITRSRSSKPPLAQLIDLFHIVMRQLEELIDAWSELSGILAERAEVVGAGANDGLCAGLRDDENPEYLAVEVARTLESHLQRLRSGKRREHDQQTWLDDVNDPASEPPNRGDNDRLLEPVVDNADGE
jgi:hypothetical protein